MPYAPLFVRSQYSILAACSSVKQLVTRAKEEGLSSLAVTDMGSLYGAVDFYKECRQADIHPILGCELFVAPGSRREKQKIPGVPPYYSLLAYALNETGYRNLCRLSSLGHLEGFYYVPRIDRELLQKYGEGVLLLTGAQRGRLGSALHDHDAGAVAAELSFLRECFPDRFYLQINRNTMTAAELEEDDLEREPWLLAHYQEQLQRQERINTALIELAQREQLPYVATHETAYLERGDWAAHEILLNIQSGEACEIWERDSTGMPKQRIPNPKRSVMWSHALHMLSPPAMERLFEDLPQALACTQEIAERCQLTLDFKKKHYPVFVPPELRDRPLSEEERRKAAETYLRSRCQEALQRKYDLPTLEILQAKFPDQPPMQLVQQRLEYELDLLVSKDLGDYLLIVHDIIRWAKQAGIPVGPGRGSGAGSIVCYLLDITEIEPLRFDLFFERFINPERLSYPDIDVDICMDRRGEVINYVTQRYGEHNIAQIITFGTIKAKMAIKDVGRVLSVPLAKVNQISKLVPEDPSITLDKALQQDPELHRAYEEDPEVQRIVDLGRRIEGSLRNTGVHAAGVIIAAGPITEFVPVCSAKDSQLPVTQFAMKPVEAVGMLKMDLLGLKTLTGIQLTCDSIRASCGVSIDWQRLPLEDPATFSLLNHGKTMGVFQLESAGMRELARQIQIDRFEELIAMVSLYRPGPMEMIPSFIRRKHGQEVVEVDHPEMEALLRETHGIMVYQEQVMQIAQRLAGYSLGEGDVLRRAMGKKDAQQMAEQRVKFLHGAQQRGIEEGVATRIFDKMERFASYGFNKSHAAAYAMLAYITAYLKANYPAHWIAALMTCDRDDVTKLSKLAREARSLGISVLPPDLNRSEKGFAAYEQEIRFALGGIKGVGEGVVEALLEERARSGPFQGLRDCLQRIDLKKCHKKPLELLIEAGAFDFTGWSRDALRVALEPEYDRALQEQRERRAGILDLFACAAPAEALNPSPPEVEVSTTPTQRWMREKELLGFFLSGHPLDPYQELLQRLGCTSFSQFGELRDPTVVRAACIIEQVTTRISQKTGKKFAIMQVSDGEESYELPVWPELYEQSTNLLIENGLLYCVFVVEPVDEGELRLQARWFHDLREVDEQVVQACDRAYDRARNSLRYTAQRAANTGPVAQKHAPPAASSPPLQISLDSDAMRLSHVLELKGILRAHAGSQPLELAFFKQGAFLARLVIQSRWGVQYSPRLKQALEGLSGVLQVQASTK